MVMKYKYMIDPVINGLADEVIFLDDGVPVEFLNVCSVLFDMEILEREDNKKYIKIKRHNNLSY